MRERMRRVMPLLVTAIVVFGCTDPADPATMTVHRGGHASSTEGCYPPGPDCQEREATDDEWRNIRNALARMRSDGYCGTIQRNAQRLVMALRIRVWTSGSNSDNYYGDWHHAVDLMHMTPAAMSSADEIQRTLIHETVHSMSLGEGSALIYEEQCFGV